MNEAINIVIGVMGGQKPLAKALGRTQAAISKWKLGARVPVEDAMEMERLAKGSTTREQICPKVNFARP